MVIIVDTSRQSAAKTMNKSNNSSVLTEEAKQVIIASSIGDGHITHNKLMCSSKFREYMEFKSEYFKNLIPFRLKDKINGGFKKSPITLMDTTVHPFIAEVGSMTLVDKLSKLTGLGIAIWFYDDGSLHKTKHFYNLNTHSYTKEEHTNIIIPFLESKLGVKVRLAYDRKKDGRVFCYCRIGKRMGAEKVMNLLNKYPVSCYSYKSLSPETIEKEFKPTNELARRSKEKTKLSRVVIK